MIINGRHVFRFKAAATIRQARLPGKDKEKARKERLQTASASNEMSNISQTSIPRGLEGKRITYILPAVALYGGVVSVFQIVNNLVLSGVDVNVVTCGRVDENVINLFPTYFRPYAFGSESEMLQRFPESDLVVATGWKTVYSAVRLKATRTSVELAYFVQDFEPDFYEEGTDNYDKAERTYRLIPRQIVKTNWLKEMIAPYGGDVRIIPIGLNLDYFHDTHQPRKRQIIAMARRSSKRRNFDMLVAVYNEVYRRRPDIELAVYGTGYTLHDFACPVKDYGKIEVMKQVVRVINESLVLLDPSSFQGFGRPGLEAMACGTAAVLTDTGGITQYAKHLYNCLLINPHDRDDIVEKLIALIDDDELRTSLIIRGLETSRRYSDKVEALATKKYFTDVLSDEESVSEG